MGHESDVQQVRIVHILDFGMARQVPLAKFNKNLVNMLHIKKN